MSDKENMPSRSMPAVNEPSRSQIIYPLTRAQERIWLRDQIEPNSLFYHISLAYSLEGNLNLDVLETSVRSLLEKHRILRTSFHEVGGYPRQFVRQVPTRVIEVEDLRTCEPSRIQHEEEQLLEDALGQQFDLSIELPIRVKLFKLADDQSTLVIILHHIVTDMVSMDILCRELSELYNHGAMHQSSLSESADWDYLEYALWDQSEERRQEKERHEHYWQSAFHPQPASPDLPYDYPRTPGKQFVGAVERLTVSRRAFWNLKTLCKDQKTTLFNGLFAAYLTFLYKITGQSQLVVGTFVANRHRQELQNMVGLLFNDLPILAHVREDQSFTDLMRSIRRNVVNAIAHADCDVEQAIRKGDYSNLEPLTNTTFQLYQRNDERLQFVGIKARQRRVFQGTKFDLMFYGSASDQTLDIWFNYNSHLFEQSTIQRFLHYFNTLLQNIVDNPDAPISSLSLLTQTERHELLFGNAVKRQEYPRDVSIAQAFEQVAGDRANFPAVTGDHGSSEDGLSYRELNQQANRLAWILREHGVKGGTPVGVFMERSTDMVVADLAILKSGGACLLLDVNYPAERVNFMIRHADAALVITSKNVDRTTLPSEVEVLDFDDERIANQSDTNLPLNSGPDDTAFIVYTSGSSGQPKGVMLTHRGVINQVYHRIHEFKITTQDRLCLSLSVAFSTLPLQLLTPLLSGCELIVYSQDTVTDTRVLVTASEDAGVSLLEITVSSLGAWLRSIRGQEHMAPRLSKLRYLVTAGEKLTSVVARLFYDRYPHVALVTTFGQSECTGIITNAEVPTSVQSRIVEGFPSRNNRVYLLDQNLEPVPHGVIGTVYFTGDSVAKGYINSPEETRRVFLANPFVPGQTMLDTGDRAIQLRDGQVSVLGRKDMMVKIRGNRVEIPEIEQVIRMFSGVSDCAVASRLVKDEAVLAAYYTTEAMVSENELREFVGSKLPDYMVPSYIIELDSIPLNPNQKADRQSLPDPTSIARQQRQGEAPQTATEERLASIWREVLQVKDIVRNDSFFALGGQSLLAMEAAASAYVIFRVDVSVQDLFLHPTLSALAARIDVLAEGTRE